ncbi:MAG: hypothetical protein J0H14_05605 [Alphaproteobacteria bacterium]|nr:hypothetical protein [Alphaproteobacteria bacterium]
MDNWLDPVLLRTVWHDKLVFVATFIITFALLSLGGLFDSRPVPSALAEDGKKPGPAKKTSRGSGKGVWRWCQSAWRWWVSAWRWRLSVFLASLTVLIVSAAMVYGLFTTRAELGLDAFLAGLGGAFGCLLAWKIMDRLLPRTGVEPQEPISVLAVAALCVLLIVLNFPVFRYEFALLLDNLNLTTLKVPSVLEIGFGQRSETARQSTVSSGGVQAAAASFQRSSDPAPGLKALNADLRGDPKGYMPADRRYIEFFYMMPGQSTLVDAQIGRHYIEAIDKAEQQLRPMRALAACLREYVAAYPDSHILLIDIKPIIAALFDVHASAKSTQGVPKIDDARWINSAIAEWLGNFRKRSPLRIRLSSCNDKKLINENGPDTSVSSPAETYFAQPYIAIALADLLMTYGAPSRARGPKRIHGSDFVPNLSLWRCFIPSLARQTGPTTNLSDSTTMRSKSSSRAGA